MHRGGRCSPVVGTGAHIGGRGSADEEEEEEEEEGKGERAGEQDPIEGGEGGKIPRRSHGQFHGAGEE